MKSDGLLYTLEKIQSLTRVLLRSKLMTEKKLVYAMIGIERLIVVYVSSGCLNQIAGGK